ncbi:matrixin family metalloprotease [Rothia sp. SD9660Na]|uniref:matrixin family metalloprotease n=1 Tax=Rothia sp. SD9660Na TaxID=3047030 RepID=UPI0024B8B91E|nr:matrixin family metalloprotease [Rothia sp. SD9660Na]WHS50226.1 matrixin family metalloprotease [Rothia sp. SD9660Na]
MKSILLASTAILLTQNIAKAYSLHGAKQEGKYLKIELVNMNEKYRLAAITAGISYCLNTHITVHADIHPGGSRFTASHGNFGKTGWEARATWRTGFRSNIIKSGSIHMNEAYCNSMNGLNLRVVTMHEIGHLLGLGHSKLQNAIMYTSASHAFLRHNTFTPTNDDKAGLRKLYI